MACVSQSSCDGPCHSRLSLVWMALASHFSCDGPCQSELGPEWNVLCASFFSTDHWSFLSLYYDPHVQREFVPKSRFTVMSLCFCHQWSWIFQVFPTNCPEKCSKNDNTQRAGALLFARYASLRVFSASLSNIPVHVMSGFPIG